MNSYATLHEINRKDAKTQKRGAKEKLAKGDSQQALIHEVFPLRPLCVFASLRFIRRRALDIFRSHARR